MAAGDGFKQVPFGFDKNEVNTYISDLRKKMSALEADMRKNDEKTRAAEKLAEEADSRIQAAIKEGSKKADELSALLDAEKETTDRQRIEIRNLKDRLDSEKKKMTDMLKNGKGVSAEATRAFNEVLEKANEEAAGIIDKAKKQAEDIIAAAKQQQSDISSKTTDFLEQLREQLELMNTGYNAINTSAAELIGTEIAAVTLPEIPVVTAVEAAPETAEEPEAEPETAETEPAEEITFEPEQTEEPEPEAEPEPAEEPEAEPAEAPEEAAPEEEESADDLFSEDWSGNKVADAVAAAEKMAASDAKSDIPLVNPDAGDNMFGGDLFNMDDNSDDMNGFDMDKHEENEEPEEIVDSVKPLDMSEQTEASYDRNFDKDLLSQTMNSSSLGNDADDELLAAVKAAEEAFAVQPNDVSEIDMDDQPEASSAESDEDELMKALREAEEALNSVKESADAFSSEPEEEAPAAEDPWADLQKQLEAMESANGAGSAVTYDEPEPVQQEEPQAAPPSADDSSIWDFSGSSQSGSDDDDMSSDFGGFGGF